MANSDAVAAVEACYALDVDDDTWLQQLADAMHPLLQPEIGLLAYQLLPPGPSAGYRIGRICQSADSALELVPKMAQVRDLLERRHAGAANFIELAQAAVLDRIFQTGVEEPVNKVLWSERETVGPRWMHTLFTPIEDQHVLLARHLAGGGVTAFVSGLASRRTVEPRDRELWTMILAHVDAGQRLRARLAGALGDGLDAPPGGAVLDDGRVVHADGDATVPDLRAALQRAAQEIDRARASKGGRGVDAVEVWQGLVDGRWSLVESFDTDGRRFVLAHRNEPGVGDARALTELETWVVGLAVRGCSDKLIGYTLGIARSTAAGHLASAMKKLQIARRVDLVRYLGPRFPEG